MHAFELSGLGKAPFKVVNPTVKQNLEHGQVFFCEHCGTTIKNRHFIKSADGKLSVVGIDCLKKTGDQGLLDGERRIRKEQRDLARMAAYEESKAKQEAEERKHNNGLTIAESVQALKAQIADKKNDFYALMLDEAVVNSLSKMGFEISVRDQLLNGTLLSDGQKRVLTEILAKKQSKSRKGSKAFQAALAVAIAQVDALLVKVSAHCSQVEEMEQQIKQKVYG